jgi:ABC-type antimicrobial peptide transport system permease subunit
MTAVVRVDPSAAPSPERLRAAARELDPALAVEVATLAGRVRVFLAERRLLLGSLGTFGGVSLLLTCVGVFALFSYAAEERRREIAIRATLGATREGLLGMMLRDALRVVAWGVAGGMVVAFALGGAMESLLLDVGAADPLTYVAAALLLVGVGLGAALLPSWRAARSDPLTALGR